MQRLPKQCRGLVTPIDGPMDLETSDLTLKTKTKMGQMGTIPVKIALFEDTILVFSSETSSLEPLGCLELGFKLTLKRIYAAKSSKLAGRANSQGTIVGFRLTDAEGKSQSFRLTVKMTQLWIKELSKHVVQDDFEGHYQKLRELGKGSSATIYEAKRRSDRRHFAVKVFKKSVFGTHPAFYKHFVQELNTLKRLNHPNLLTLEEVYESEDCFCMIVPLLGGTNMFQYLVMQKQRLSPESICSLMEGLLYGLAELERAELVHRDIKLENVMVKEQEDGSVRVVIVDMGIAVTSPHPPSRKCGTPGYISPEVVGEKDDVTCVSDVFSAGIILHILITGRPLFQGTNQETVFNNNCSITFDLQHPFYDLVDRSAFDLLRGMLEIDPQRRLTASQCLSHPYLRRRKSSVGTGTEMSLGE